MSNEEFCEYCGAAVSVAKSATGNNHRSDTIFYACGSSKEASGVVHRSHWCIRCHFDAVKMFQAVNELRSDECSGVMLPNDNPEGSCQCAVEVRGPWTNGYTIRFQADTIVEALQDAVAAKRKTVKP